MRVSLFETNIRLLGGLLSGHLIASDKMQWLKMRERIVLEQIYSGSSSSNDDNSNEESAGDDNQLRSGNTIANESSFIYNGELLHLVRLLARVFGSRLSNKFQ